MSSSSFGQFAPQPAGSAITLNANPSRDYVIKVAESRALLAQAAVQYAAVTPGGPALITQASSLGELLAQGKGNLEAWWISLTTFAVLVLTLLLLTFMGEALRDALDTRKANMQ